MSLRVGLFDSGLGGLTVLRQVHARYPHSATLYLGDTARVPYGDRSPQEIRQIAAEVVHWLRLQGIGVLVMACNTSNALALDVAVAEAGVPVVGLIDSVAASLDAQRIGVLATPATAASGAYRRAIHACQAASTVIEVACPDFVPLIEAGDLDDPDLRRAAQLYLQPLLEQQVEAIVLGCTHYPLLQPLLRQLLPPSVALVDPAEAAVTRLGPLLASLGDLPEAEQRQEPAPNPLAHCRICVTGSALSFAQAAGRWLAAVPSVEQVVLQRREASGF